MVSLVISGCGSRCGSGCNSRCGSGCGAECDSRCGQLHVVIVGVVYALKAKDRDYVMEFTAFLFGNINEEGELENEDLLGRVSDVEIGGFKGFTVTFL